MNSPLFHLKKRKLAPEYFNFKQPWLFNTPDILPFAYILAGLFVSLLLMGLLLLLFVGTSGTPTQNSEAQQSGVEQAVSTESENTETAFNENELSPLVKNSQSQADFETRLRQAETQPTYDLKIQALLKLEEDPEISVEQKESLKTLKKGFTQKLTTAQKNFVAIENAMEKEYYSTAIRKSEALIAEGKILGVIFTNAQEALEKAHFRKIDYYLREAKLGKAEAALKEAQKKDLNAEKLDAYDKKIKALKAL